MAQGESQGVLFQRGQIIANRYTVIDLIGRGGMGCIYRVNDNTLDEEVALKTLLPQFVRDKVVVERFYNEARIARQLSHTNIVRVHDIGFAGSVLYISMEYLRGKSLRALMDELPPGQRLPIRTTLKIMDELCAALEYAHHYTVHRDIKPENIMIASDGRVKLMDFGISKLMTHNNLTAVSMVMGTPYYMSPEQLKDSRNVDNRADIYSVGVVLYEMLTGNLPTGIIKPASQTMSDVPASLDPIVAKCVETDPRNRYATVHGLHEALRPIQALIESGTAPGSPAAVKEGPPPQWRRILGLALATVLVAAAGFALWRLEQQRVTAVAATPPERTDAVTDPVTSGFEEARALIAESREQARPFVGDDPVKQKLAELGNRYLNRAETLWQEGSPDAMRVALSAAACFAGIAVAPSDMVFIPPGDVVLSDRKVWVDGFLIDRREVSNEEFVEFCRDPDRAAFAVTGNGNPWAPAADPAAVVDFVQAQAFAAAVNKKLPTFEQWVRATVDLEDGFEAYDASAAGSDDSEEDDVTAFGCRDMAGGVPEWTRSLYSDSSETGSVEVTGQMDAKALLHGAAIVCGGSEEVRQLSKVDYVPVLEPKAGFRCVWEAPQTVAAMRNWLRRGH